MNRKTRIARSQEERRGSGLLALGSGELVLEVPQSLEATIPPKQDNPTMSATTA
jgi:hypothetical protein